ncbi:MAG: AAA domain-containing protein [Bacteroidota bacterium]
MEYFDNLLVLLEIEKKEDLILYQQLASSSSAAVRRQNGLCWYPVAIRNSELGRGDYLNLELERTTHHELKHQFRFGSSVVLFSNHDPKIDRIEGIIDFVDGNSLKITFRTDDLPEWTRQGKLGVDLQFDNYTYNEMQNALKRAAVCAEKPIEEPSKLVNVLIGAADASFKYQPESYINPTLNFKQQCAVSHILSANDLAIVHGPPGTGKTTTLVQAIKCLIKSDGQQVLVVAPSNTAIDLLTEKLADEGLEVLRIGNPARVSEKMLSYTLDRKHSEHESNKSVKKLKKQAAEYKKMAHKYKRNFGRAEQEQRKALFNEAHKLSKEADDTEQFVIEQHIGRAQVITATLVGANHYTLKNKYFETVVIDEAGQALEPACWIPALKGKKLVLAGDHHQLSPTIKSNEAARRGLSKTLLEKCIEKHPNAVILLEEQYRMHEKIMTYSSRVFYNNQLIAHESVAMQNLFKDDNPVLFIDTAGCGFDEKSEGTSVQNPEEAAFLVKHLTLFLNELCDFSSTGTIPNIGIIAPYQEQVKLLRVLFSESSIPENYISEISINSVDGFQGQERDIIYLSLTRSNNDQSIGFLSDIRRMNVAMTRAKKKLVVIGDSATLSKLPYYADFVSYVDQIGGYHSAWEFNQI